MRPIPIFDTQIFSHVQDGLITDREWRRLRRRRPGHGWPLSSVTVLELLAGLADLPPRKYLRFREQINLAFTLSNGRILEDPRYLLCTQVLRIPFPSDLVPPSSQVLKHHMEAVRHSRSLVELGRYMRSTTTVKEVVAGPKKQWMERTEEIATKIYPEWRELFQRKGRRLPPELRKTYESWPLWEAQRTSFVRTMLTWLGANTRSDALAEMDKRLDAVLNFTLYVAREFLISNYSLEKHESDVFDQFQLQYLAMDRFIIVSNDADFRTRVARSSQASRIMTFTEFLQSL